MKSRKQSVASAMVEGLEQRRLLASGDLGYAGAFGWYDEQDSGQAIAVDNDGNTYVAGYFRGLIDVDVTKRGKLVLKSGRAQAGFLAKYSPQGKLLWAKRMVGEGNVSPTQVKVAPNGDVYVGGTFDGPFGFRGGSRDTLLTTDSGADVFFMRLRSNGRVRWVGSVGGSRDDSLSAMDVGPNGDLYYAGAIRMEGDVDPSSGVQIVETRGVDDTIISRVRGSDGKLVWAKVYGETDSAEGVTGLAVDATGGVFVTGAYYRTVAFDRENPKFTLDEIGGMDLYLGRLTANGAWDWVQGIGGEEDEIGGGLDVGPTGDVYLTGTFEATAQFQPGVANSALTSLGERDAFVARYNSRGKLAWARQFGGEDGEILAKSVAVDNTGAVYATGDFNGTVSFGTGRRGATLTTDKSDDAPELNWMEASDVYVVKLTANGALATTVGKWAYVKQIGGEDAGMSASAIAVTPNGDVLLTGGYAGRADLDPGPGTFFRKTSDERRELDAFLVKLLA